jgi:hypothetical protein
MASEQNRSANESSRPRPTRAQRIVAAGFLGAFGLTILTVLLTGLWVRAPDRRQGSQQPPAAVGEPSSRVERAPSAAPKPVVPPDQAQRESAEGADVPHERANADAASERQAPENDGR